MSINSAMLAGVSGLRANSAALASISQNIANVNTVGYKRTASEFQTLVNSQTASGGSYSAGGVTTGAVVSVPEGGGVAVPALKNLHISALASGPCGSV